MRRSAVAALVLVALLATTGAAQTVQTFGADMAWTPLSSTYFALGSNVGDATYVCPVSGRLTTWRVNSAEAHPEVTMRILRPQDGDFCIVAQDTRAVVPGVNEFTIDLPIAAGDVLGMLTPWASIVTAMTTRSWNPSASAVGECLTYEPAPYGFTINADVDTAPPVPFGGPAASILLAAALGLLGWRRLRATAHNAGA